MLKGKKAVLFDMDGTLIDSVGVWNEVDRRLLTQLGVENAQDIDVQAQRDAALVKFSASDSPYEDYCSLLAEKYGLALSGAEVVDIRYKISQELIENEVAYKPNAPELLKKLRTLGLTLAIVSTTKRDNMKTYMTRNRNICGAAPLGEFFAAIFTREDAERLKPDPDAYLRAMRQLGLKPEDCLVFEDSLVGVQAAKAAGLQTAVIYDKYSDADRQEIERLADRCFADWAQVLEALEN